MKYYHYTTITSLELILSEDRLIASYMTGTDAALGEGVYFTTMSPDDFSMEEIFRNNWARHLRDGDKARMDVCIEIEDEGSNMITGDAVGQRDVWLYRGADMTGLKDRISQIYINHANQRSWSPLLRQMLQSFRGCLMKLTYPAPPSRASPQASSSSCASPSPPASSSSSNYASDPTSSSSTAPIASGGGWGRGLLAFGMGLALLGTAAYLGSKSSTPNRQVDYDDDDDDDSV